MIRLVEYIAPNGRNHFAEWLLRIPQQHRRQVAIALHRMSRGNFGDHKSVGESVMERRIHGSPAIRIYYAMEGADVILLLAGGTKHRQDRDIAKAKALWAAYKEGK